MPIRVALLNDYQIVLSGLAHMLEPFAERVTVIHGAADTTSPQPWNLADLAHPPDVVLYDTFAHSSDIAQVLADSGAGRLVVYSWSGDERSVQEALGAGASGYLAKGITALEVVEALEKVADGEVVVTTGSLPSRRSASARWPGSGAHLSARESEVIAWLAQGLTNDEIADRTSLSSHTVKTYIRSSYRKMGVTSRSQAVLWALDRGFRSSIDRHQSW